MPRIAPLIELDTMQRTTLQQLVKTPSTSQSQALRARIILAAAKGQANQHIARELGIPEITVSKWRRRFATRGLEALQDAPRLGRPRKYGPEVGKSPTPRLSAASRSRSLECSHLGSRSGTAE